MYHITYTAPTGTLYLTADTEHLLSVTTTQPQHPAGREQGNDILTQTVAELDAYFAGELTTFTVPHKQPGGDTILQQAQHALTTIPYGQTRSYKQIAQQVHHPKAARTVGTACATNPLLIIVPCHRVIRADGTYGHYAGGAAMKQYLLDLERA